MNRSKQKGTAAETSVVRYLAENGFPHAERRSLAGINDRGDVTGIPNLVIEIKAQAKLEIPAWLRETAVETKNAKAEVGILVVKPKGVGDANVGKWWAIVELATMTDLLRDGGFGNPRERS